MAHLVDHVDLSVFGEFLHEQIENEQHRANRDCHRATNQNRVDTKQFSKSLTGRAELSLLLEFAHGLRIDIEVRQALQNRHDS